MRRVRCLLAILLGCLCVSKATAEVPQAVPVAGEPFRAQLVAADSQWQLKFRVDNQDRMMPAVDLVTWGQCPEQGRGGGLVLADGSFVAAQVVAANKDSLTADSDTLGTLKLPLESLSGLVLQQLSHPSDNDKLLDRIANPAIATVSPHPLGEGQGMSAPGEKESSRPQAGKGARTAVESDRLLLDNGDELTGLFGGMADGVVQWTTDVGPVKVKLNRVVAVLFNPALKRKLPPRQHQMQAWVGLSDGSRLLAAQLSLDADLAKITAAGETFTAQPSSLVFLQPLGGRAIYLSDLKPSEYHQTPYLNLTWPCRADRNVTGSLLRCNRRLYLKGLGVHSAARLVYDLSPRPQAEQKPGARQGNEEISPRPQAGEGQGDSKETSPRPLGEGPGVRADGAEISPRPQAGEGPGVRADSTPKRFEALLGLDDSTQNQGSVQFRVLLDGQEKFKSPVLRGGDPPQPISIDIAGGKKLELILDYADRADVLDHADWLDARLIN